MKLEDIPRKNPYTVPDGYFDRLPGVVESRISEEGKTVQGFFHLSASWGLAIAAAVVLGLGMVWYTGFIDPKGNVQSELASISPDQLAQFLSDQDLTADELTDQVDWSNEDLNDLENSVYSNLGSSTMDVDQVINEMDNEI